MQKPQQFRTKYNPHWGTEIKVPTFNTSDGYHTAHAEWARSKRKSALNLSVTCADDSVIPEFHEFERMVKPVPYCIPWEGKEPYHVDVDTSRFDADFLSDLIPTYCNEKGAKIAEIKQAMYQYMTEVDSGIKSCKFSYIPV